MSPSVRRLLVALSAPVVAVGLGGLYALIRRGGTHELPSIFVWSLPLALPILLFTRKPHFTRLSVPLRLIVTVVVGLVIGVAWTGFGWFIMGPWMLAWDFPVLYCWVIASVVGTLGSAIDNDALKPRIAGTGFVLALAPLAIMWWYAARPWPAVLVVYNEDPRFDAAQRVLDSVLTEPYVSGGGRDIKWPTRSYLRTITRDGQTAALIAVERGDYRDSIRVALAGNPLVARVVDTVMSH